MASDGLEAHARRIAELISELEALPDSGARTIALELIENIDHLHRTCIWRMFEVLSELGGKGLVDRMVTDPAVKTLFVLYDLVPSVPLVPVEASGNVAAPYSSGFVPLSAVAGLNLPPSFRVAFQRKDVPPGSLRAVEIDGRPVLLAALDADAETFAYRNQCLGSILPLHLGTLDNGVIHCPWHGCRYDARTGERIEGGDGHLERFLVRVEGDIIRVESKT
jgi:nitrite reductase/ring-hydroxylating ferredoxin subunit